MFGLGGPKFSLLELPLSSTFPTENGWSGIPKKVEDLGKAYPLGRRDALSHLMPTQPQWVVSPDAEAEAQNGEVTSLGSCELSCDTPTPQMHVQVLTPGAREWGLVWKSGLCRCN